MEHDELKDIYLYTQSQEGLELKFQKLEEPIVTRWWLVGACAVSFLAAQQVWTRICDGIRKTAPSDSASYKVAVSTLALIKEPMIMSDVHLIAAFHNWFLFSHFKWCQLGDPEVGGTPSFQSRHMLVRFFIMLTQVEDAMEEKWMDMAEFNKFVRSLDNINDNEKEIQKKKVAHFLRIVKGSLTKHFKMWVSEKIFFLSLFGEQVIATCVARFLLGQGQEYEGDYESVSHGRKINMTKFVFFLCGHCKENEIRAMRSSPFMLANGLAIRMLADGGNIWDSSSHPPLQEFCNLYKTSYAALPTNSQFTDCGVKESGYVSLGHHNKKIGPPLQLLALVLSLKI